MLRITSFVGIPWGSTVTNCHEIVQVTVSHGQACCEHYIEYV